MPTDPNISLQVKPIEAYDPIAQYAKIQGVRNMIGQQQLQQQQIQQSQVQTADIQAQASQRQRELDSNNKAAEFLADPENQQAIARGDFHGMWAKGVSPAIGIPIMQHAQEYTAKAQAMKKDAAEFTREGLGQLQNVLEGVDPKDDAAAATQYNAAIPLLAQSYPDLAKNLKPLNPADPNVRGSLKGIAISNGISAAIMDHQATLNSKNAETGARTAAADKDTADAALTRAKTALYDPNPQALSDALSKANLDLDLSNQAKLLIPTLRTPEARDSALETIFKEQAGRNTEKDPSIAAARNTAEVNKERQLIPVRVAAAVQTEAGKARLAGGIGQIIDPQQRNEASRTLDAADKEATDKIAAANSLKNTVQMALAGNKVAPNLETIEELRSIVNRVNGQELKSVGAAGNAYDRAAGWLGSWTAGQPIPDNIQKDFLAVADGQLKVAQQKHATAYGVVGQRFGVKGLQPPDIASIYANAAGAGTTPPKYKVGDTRTINGRTVTRDASGNWN